VITGEINVLLITGDCAAAADDDDDDDDDDNDNCCVEFGDYQWRHAGFVNVGGLFVTQAVLVGRRQGENMNFCSSAEYVNKHRNECITCTRTPSKQL